MVASVVVLGLIGAVIASVAAGVPTGSLKDQLPVEISGRGVRYADAENVQAKAAGTEDVLRDIDIDIRWLRKMVGQLSAARRKWCPFLGRGWGVGGEWCWYGEKPGRGHTQRWGALRA